MAARGARVTPCGLEAIAAAATASGGETPVGALAAVLRPARVLAVGVDSAALAATVPDATIVTLDPDADRAARATCGSVRAFHAALRPAAQDAPHFTHLTAFVELLREPGFDLVLLGADESARALYDDLAQLVALVSATGVLLCEDFARCPDGTEAVVRLLREGQGRGLLWHAPGRSAPSLLMRAPLRTRVHGDTDALRDQLTREHGGLRTALEQGAHETVCRWLRSWLAARLTWSTRDLTLPLTALPPSLTVEDVIERCQLGEGGVGALGAALTLAMLYRSFGYPATVYQHGVAGLYGHTVTLVGTPPGRVLVEDALLDTEPQRKGAAVPWPDIVMAVRQNASERIAYAAGGLVERPHLYSLAGLAQAAADGFLTPAEQSRLAAELASVAPQLGVPRAALRQRHTCSVDAYVAVTVNRRSLAAARLRSGLEGPLSLLAAPLGGLPLTGEPWMDEMLARVLVGAESAS